MWGIISVVKRPKLIIIISILLGIALIALTAYYIVSKTSDLSIDDIGNLESSYSFAGSGLGNDDVIMGKYKDRTVVARYSCNDLCRPNKENNTFIVYKDVEESKCVGIGGSIVEIRGWGMYYVGCSPLSNYPYR